MSHRRGASMLRQHVARLTRERARVERELLRRRRMIAGSLIERHLGTREQKRASPAFYVSCAVEGRTRLVYVPKRRVERVRGEVEAWRAYRQALRRWRELMKRMGDLLRELGDAQAEDPAGGRR